MRTAVSLFLILFSICGAGTSAAGPLPVQADASEWSAANAHALAVASGIAYTADRDSLRKEVKEQLGMEDVVPFAWSTPPVIGRGEGGTQGFIAADDACILLIFRGTEANVIDVITDAWVRPVAVSSKVPQSTAPGMVHEGFAAALAVVWPDIRRELTAAVQRHPKARIWLGGHSLGGALAFTAASALSHTDGPALPLQGVIGFGTPVTGDTAFCEGLEKALPGRVHRCVCSFDLVGEDLLARSLAGIADSWLPRWSWQVPGRLVYFDAAGSAHTSVGLILQGRESYRFFRSLEIRPKDLVHKDRALDLLRRSAEKLAARHDIGETYTPALRRLAEETAAGKAAKLVW